MLDDLLSIVVLSLYVSGVALVMASVLGVPAGAWLALNKFPARRVIELIVFTGMGLPPVVAGLFVYLALSRSGWLGGLGWLFTPKAMIVAQVIIALPVTTGLTMSAVQSVNPNLPLQVRSLGASPTQTVWTLLAESRGGVAAAVVAAFGSIISEVGAVMLVGGNIDSSTRVLTTAIVLETRKGNFELAMALGAVLLSLTFVINVALLQLSARRMR